MKQQIPLVAVVGPTASGKTGLGVELALALNGEVISADSMQIYRGLRISTARPAEEEMKGIPHHLIGFLDLQEGYSVARYLEDAAAAVREVVSRGRLPILVGGTGLYINSLLDGIRFSPEKTDPEVRRALAHQAEQEGNEAMHRQLSEIDPEYAATLHPNNLGRVLRALELFKTTGRTMSRQLAESRTRPSDYAPVIIGLDYADRSLLYERIDARVDMMLSDGLLDEARAFYENSGAQTSAQAIGCKELKPFFDGKEPLGVCVEALKRETRRYAKRQLTWFRRDERIHWLKWDEFDTKEALIRTAVDIASSVKR